jgi:hypothetical protein
MTPIQQRKEGKEYRYYGEIYDDIVEELGGGVDSCVRQIIPIRCKAYL